jgi:uncharacterized protein
VILVADTSGLLATLDRAHVEHQRCREALNGAALTVVSPMVLTELDHLLRRSVKQSGDRGGRGAGARRSRQVLDWILGEADRLRMAVPPLSAGQLRVAGAVMDRYAGLALDLADAVTVVLAQEYATDAVLTLDHRDFRGIRPLTDHNAFRILPADL